MILECGKSYKILDLRKAYLSPDKSPERESLYQYEYWLHKSGIFVDKYDRTNLKTASRLHQKNLINGLLFQYIWYSESCDSYNLEEVQECSCINIEATNEMKYNPDFIFKKTHKTCELKFTDCNKYFNNDHYLTYTKDGQLVEPKNMHFADVAIVCSIVDGILLEYYCIRQNNCYNIRYITNSKRTQRINKLFTDLRVY